MISMLLMGCLVPYTLVQYKVPSLPDTYMTSPQERDNYCEVGFIYSEGFTIEEAKLNLYKPVRDGTASAIVNMEYGVKQLVIEGGGVQYTNAARVPIQSVYTASGVLITWGKCH